MWKITPLNLLEQKRNASYKNWKEKNRISTTSVSEANSSYLRFSVGHGGRHDEPNSYIFPYASVHTSMAFYLQLREGLLGSPHFFFFFIVEYDYFPFN